ncbi:hypothetical protein JHL17_23555 [Azospirillum sp. YIM B02556]|uniref:Uncharacterized protein n=1 Tax=Azospirillum endophyticum TaxID=2800326 RepID=A0ABS1FAD0_9PROT|nr:hypothetical protein [Azospirillum endophyticum]MBK1840384.1 hypothetical protein [Azospirillum endophyticum]
MALLDRDDRGRDGASAGDKNGFLAGVDRRLLVVALALGLLTSLAVVDQYRPTPGAAAPVEWRLPSMELPRTVPMATAPNPRQDGPRHDELLGAD